MLDAPVGDDVYAEDPTVNAHRTSPYAGQRSRVVAPNGTQSNLLALFATVIVEMSIWLGTTRVRYEGGGAAVLSGISPQPLPMAFDGTLALDDLEAAIKPADFHFARSRVICLENTHAGEPFHSAMQRPSRPG